VKLTAMNKYSLLFILIIGGYIASAQPPGIPAPERASVSVTTGEFNVYDKGRMATSDQVLSINGKKVAGSVFLYQNWNDGTIITTDGKGYTGYKLKYDAYNQVVFFLEKNQSLEVSQKIKQFSLVVPNEKGSETFTFLHSDIIKKARKPFYYEVLVEDGMGYLLKVNQKEVVEAQKGLPVADATKELSLNITYYYFDKNARSLSKINANGANIKEILSIKGDELRTEGYDFASELSLKEFFIAYFAKNRIQMKAF
jgi:hypothetical protein